MPDGPSAAFVDRGNEELASSTMAYDLAGDKKWLGLFKQCAPERWDCLDPKAKFKYHGSLFYIYQQQYKMIPLMRLIERIEPERALTVKAGAQAWAEAQEEEEISMVCPEFGIHNQLLLLLLLATPKTEHD